MGSLFDGRRNLLVTGIGFGAVIMTQCGCHLLVDFDDLSDTRGGNVLSGMRFGNADEQRVQGAVVDMQGQVVVAGRTTGTNPFDDVCGGAGKGLNDMFVAWIDPAITPLDVQCPATRIVGGSGNDVSFGIAANKVTGGIGIAGQTGAEIDFGKGPLTSAGFNDVVAAELTHTSCSWAKSFGDVEDQNGRAIAFDSTGAAYVAGSFAGTFILKNMLTSQEALDAFIVKLDQNGTPLFDRTGKGTMTQEVHRLVVDSSDQVIASGYFDTSINLPDCPELTTGGAGTFVASLTGETSCNWRKQIAAGENINLLPVDPMSLDLGPNGDVFVAGSFHWTTVFPGDSRCELEETTGEDDVFVAKLSGISGDCLWSRRFGDIGPSSAGPQRAHAIAVDPSTSAVYVVGEFDKVIHFGPNQPIREGTADAFVVKLNTEGETLWSKVIPGTGATIANAVVLDPKGKFIVVAGSFNETLDLESGPLISAGDADMFVVKLSSSP